MVCLGVLKGTPIVEECDLLNLQRYIYYSNFAHLKPL